MRGRIRTGISGWTYDGWRGTFYPPGLARSRELAYATSRLTSLEINGTFYSLQRPSSYSTWREQAPEDFVYAVKAPRFITHIKRLKHVETPVANFFANGLFRLREKLGPILWQLPPSLRFDPALMEDFLALLPRDTWAASALAHGHDDKVEGRCELDPGAKRRLRHAIEVRHESFRDPRFLEMLRRARVALVTADTAGKWPRFEEQTADFSYARLHGDVELYASGYTPSALRAWAGKFERWSRPGREVYVYFDNDVKVRAPHDAMALANLLGFGPEPGRPPRPRPGPRLIPRPWAFGAARRTGVSARRAGAVSARRASAAGHRRTGSSGSPSARATRAARS
jgi:uncharacterized protein YecE (DUF72 family)